MQELSVTIDKTHTKYFNGLLENAIKEVNVVYKEIGPVW
jgi:hypothetical protein